MEIQKEVFPAAKQRTARGAKRSKFVGVRQRPSGKWVAEIKNTTQKIRMWLGTFHTAEEAARAYDEAAFLLRGSNTRTNFVNHGPVNSALSSKIRNLLNQKKASRKQSLCLTPATTIAETRTEVRNGESGVTHFDGLEKEDEQVVFGDGYKPDLSKCNGGLEMMGFSQFDQEVVGNEGYGLEGVLCKQDDFEFERMKVERQISSSLYAMNGVNEYWDIVDDSNDVFWDLPMLSQMFCQS